jgi:hypothetical protein
MSRIYRWYKIMSPHIALSVTSVAHDSANSILYVSVQQTFRIWPLNLPGGWGYRADVGLVVKLGLVYDRHWKRYYIESQEDLYSVTEMAKLLWFGLWRLVVLLQLLATAVCMLGAWVGWPVSWAEERFQMGEVKGDDVEHESDGSGDGNGNGNGSVEDWEEKWELGNSSRDSKRGIESVVTFADKDDLIKT